MSADEDRLRDRLRAVEVPPSSLRIDALVRAGRRRAFRRRTAQAAGGVALVTGVLLAVPSLITTAGVQPVIQTDTSRRLPATPSSATKSAPTGCPMTTLPVPAGRHEVSVAGVDPSGRYVVGNGFSGQDFQPVLWTDGKAQAMKSIARSVQATSVNADGIVVGLVTDQKQDYVFRYEKGVYQRLSTPVGRWTIYPYPMINAAGDVVINAEPLGRSGGADSFALLWKAGSTKATRLPLPTGANALDIGDDGTLFGAVYRNGVGVSANVWDQKGKGRQLPTPAGQVGLAYAAQGEWVTGGLWPAETAALWNLRTGAVTSLPTSGPGEAVNSAGWVVSAGAMIRDGAAAALAVPHGQTSKAIGVSDHGLVVGQARAGTADLGPRTWQC
ncbi:hypothetical protein ACWKSP_39005 [Micromonosporaceae bacterium Da 78-11]